MTFLPGLELRLPTLQEAPWLLPAVAFGLYAAGSERRNPQEAFDWKAQCATCGAEVPLSKWEEHQRKHKKSKEEQAGQIQMFGQRGLFDNPSAGDETYWRGDRARYTGKTAHGLYELELLEGHRKGEKVYAASPEQQAERARQAQQRFREEQAGFRRLRELNPDFYTDESGIVHPIRGSHDYDDFQTYGWQRQAAVEAPEAFREMTVSGGIRTPLQVQRQLERQEHGIDRDFAREVKVIRPGWARGWSKADLIGLAEYADIPVNQLREDDWADHVKPEEVSEYRDHYLTKKRSYGLPDSARERLHRRMKQIIERRSVIRSGQLARRARANPSAFSFLFGAPEHRMSPAARSEIARAAREQDKREHAVERRMKALEIKLDRARAQIRKREAKEGRQRPTRLTRSLSDAEVVRALDRGQTRLLAQLSDGEIRAALRRHGEALLSS
ncbi:MAG: hypothetical protein KGL39_12015 [Patescibacteria group bacterium]|nr:hypothetical protein [Patescibacteria group bacterium]